jgi:hypothetical protein
VTSDNAVRAEALDDEDLAFLTAVTLERFALGDWKAILEDLDETTEKEDPRVFRNQWLIGTYMDRLETFCEDGTLFDNVQELLKDLL